MAIFRKIIASLKRIFDTSSPSYSKKKKSKKIPAAKIRPKKKINLGKKKYSSRTIKQKKPIKKEILTKNDAPQGVLVGEITHFFSKIQVVVVKMTEGSIVVGDRIHIKGKNSDFVQKILSLQIESVDVKIARKGNLVGLKVEKTAQPGDKVYKLK